MVLSRTPLHNDWSPVFTQSPSQKMQGFCVYDETPIDFRETRTKQRRGLRSEEDRRDPSAKNGFEEFFSTAQVTLLGSDKFEVLKEMRVGAVKTSLKSVSKPVSFLLVFCTFSASRVLLELLSFQDLQTGTLLKEFVTGALC
jgi:hypothetical protein